jgi:hypothetical protein
LENGPFNRKDIRSGKADSMHLRSTQVSIYIQSGRRATQSSIT